MSSSIKNMCRTCMMNESNQQETLNSNKIIITQMVSILTVPEESKDELCLIELLKTTAPQLIIQEKDQLPKVVCLECSEKIKEIYRFQQNCLNVEQKFYKMLEQYESKDSFDDEYDVQFLKTEINEPFDEENSFQSNDIEMEDIKNKELLENSINLGGDFLSDEENDSDWKIQCDLIDDEIFDQYYNDDDSDEVLKPNTKKRSSTTKTKKELKPSTTKKRDRNKKNGSQQVYPCDKCNRKLKSEHSFKSHQELHNEKEKEDRIHECNICNKVFEKNYDLKEHLRTHIGELPFLCSDCGKGFNTSGGLKQHSLRHLNKSQFTCPHCPKSFATTNGLFNHVNTHKEMPKKHVCDICGRGFKTTFLLKQHQRYHNNDRRFGCEFCEKRFVTKDKLIRHTRIHTGEKPFKCSYCEKAYNQSNELKKHLHSHLGENVYQCEFCPLRFPTVKIVREHFLTHKNDDEETRARNLTELNAAEIKGIYIR